MGIGINKGSTIIKHCDLELGYGDDFDRFLSHE